MTFSTLHNTLLGLFAQPLVVEKEGQKPIAKYMEVRYGNKGGGNRGVRITLCPVLGKGTSTYIHTQHQKTIIKINKSFT